MIKNDYLTEKLEELSGIITKVVDLNREKRYEESHDLVAAAFKQMLGINVELAENLSFEDLIKFIGAYESAEAIKLMIMGDLLKLDSEILKFKGDTSKSFDISLKSLSFYLKAIFHDAEDCLERSKDSVEETIEYIDEYEIPLNTKLSIFKFYEKAKRYDKAEDLLFDLLEDTDRNSEILEEGINFYKRLLEKDEEELEAGNLPLEEVKDALENLCKLKG